MESLFSRFKNPLVLVAILLAQSLALAVQIRRPADALHPDGPQVRLLRLWTLALISPAERLSTGSGHGVRSAWAGYVDLRHVRRENEDLRREVADLRLQRAAMAEDARQGQRLQALLAFQQGYVRKTVAAQVIGTSGSDQSRVLTLDKGARAGLRPDMAVITPDGIVGKIRDVFPYSAQLLLINDSTSGAGVILQSTRTRAVLHGGATGRLQINNLTLDEGIKTGDRVITSGGDQVFPRGLAVGVIEAIVPDPEHQPYSVVTVHPAANLERLEEVLVITEMGVAVPVEPETGRASDVNAQRLPTLRMGSGDARESEAAPPAENSTGLVPKPKAVVHPDRYSPGTTPDASSLTPGGAHN